MTNPFTLTFGIKPSQYIDRFEQSSLITDTFQDEEPSNHTYIITGVRGTGKTVLLSQATELFKNNKNWYVVEVNPSRDILHSVVAKLYDMKGLRSLFRMDGIDLSLFGFGISVANGNPISDIEIALERMVSVIKKQNKRVLITIDEVTNNEYMKVFAGTYQILLRNRLPVFLLMTGLFQNIAELQNEKSLTFLYRAPKIQLSPLDLSSIMRSYQTLFNLDKEESVKMAQLTRGYSFAYQVLGYLRWEHPDVPLDELLFQYDRYLADFVYEKMYSELSVKDKEVLNAMSSFGTNAMRNIEIRSALNMKPQLFSIYRDRLLKRGLIYSPQYGYLAFVLPRFAEFIQEKFIFDNL